MHKPLTLQSARFRWADTPHSHTPIVLNSKQTNMAAQQKTGLRLGYKVPDFEADTTHGKIRFHDFIDGKWTILFSHVRSVSVWPWFSSSCRSESSIDDSLHCYSLRESVREWGLCVRARQLMRLLPLPLAISPGISPRESHKRSRPRLKKTLTRTEYLLQGLHDRARRGGSLGSRV